LFENFQVNCHTIEYMFCLYLINDFVCIQLDIFEINLPLSFLMIRLEKFEKWIIIKFDNLFTVDVCFKIFVSHNTPF